MINIHSVFFFRILAPYITGTFLGLYLLTETWNGLALVGTGLLLLLLLKTNQSYYQFRFTIINGIGIFMLFTGLGILRLHDYQAFRKEDHISNAMEHSDFLLVRTSITDSKQKKSGNRYIAKIISVANKTDSIHFPASGKIILYVSNFKKVLKTGDEIVFDLSLLKEVNLPKNPEEFNYRQFLSYQNIHHQAFLYPSQFEIIGNHAKLNIKLLATDVRNKVREKLAVLFAPDEETISFAEALMLGYKDNLDDELIDSFSKTGTLHVLAVSGLHAGIIFLILSHAFSFIEKFKKGYIIKGIIIITGIWFYAFLTGLSPSVCRASIMLSLVQTGLILNRKGNIYNTLSIAAFALLIYNPLMIVSVSFQLSFVAVTGIVFFQPKIRQLFNPPNKFLNYFWELTAVSIAAQLATFPLSVFYFHQFPLYFLLSNLVIIPLIFITLLLLIITVSLYWIPILGNITVFISSFFIKSIIWIVNNIKSLPNSSLEGLYMTSLEISLIYVLIIFLSFLLITQNRSLLMASLCVFIMLSSSVSIRTHKNKRQNFAIVHAISSQKQAVSVIKGNHAFIVCNDAFFKDKASHKFYLKPFIAKHGIKDCKLINPAENTDFNNGNLKYYSFFLTRDTFQIIYNNKTESISTQYIDSVLYLQKIQKYSVFK